MIQNFEHRCLTAPSQGPNPRPHWPRLDGCCLDATDFLDLGGRDAVDKTLQRFVKWGELRRIDRGLYDKPQFNSLTQQESAPEVRAL